LVTVMIALSQYPPSLAKPLQLLAFDLDDTLLTHGVLLPAARAALETARKAGLLLVACTGRSVEFARMFMGLCHLDAALAENGALALVWRPQPVGAVADSPRKILVCDAVAPDVRASRRKLLDALVFGVTSMFPQIALAEDAKLRRTDVTWDIGEFARVPTAQREALAAYLRKKGARTTTSSVHVHASFDAEDKASGLLRLSAVLLGCDEGQARSRVAYLGDSGNDAPAFAAFPQSFGVMNVRAHVGKMSVPPRYVATQAMGLGFVEIVETLVRARISARGD
jgi:HAD superfamily hydrolase (TIGR01484 family)